MIGAVSVFPLRPGIPIRAMINLTETRNLTAEAAGNALKTGGKIRKKRSGSCRFPQPKNQPLKRLPHELFKGKKGGSPVFPSPQIVILYADRTGFLLKLPKTLTF